MKSSRRSFIKSAIGVSTGVLATGRLLGNTLHVMPLLKKNQTPRIRFSVIGINHSHIYSQVNTVLRNGGELVGFHAKEDNLAANFSKTFPQAKRVNSEVEILEDSNIQLVVSAAIPCERAPLGVRVMEHGKDFMVDKPGITSLSQLANVRKIQQKTGRIYSIVYGRLESRTMMKASELIKTGAIGKIVQTIGTGPHRVSPESRDEWFFDKKYFGGIICDIATHQFDNFLYLTGSTSGKIIASQVGNFHFPQYKHFEDFGDAMIQGDKGSGYIRVDWLTPDGLATWGDGRLTILGTEGYMEIRDYDIAGREAGNHLFLVDQKTTQYINCREERPLYGQRLIEDILNRTETAMSQAHCFLATELTLLAQKNAIKLNTLK